LGYKIKRGTRPLRLPPSKIRSGVRSGALYAYPRQKSIQHFKAQVRQRTRRKAPVTTPELVRQAEGRPSQAPVVGDPRSVRSGFVRNEGRRRLWRWRSQKVKCLHGSRKGTFTLLPSRPQSLHGLFAAHVGLLLPKPEMQMSVLFAFVAPPLASPGL